MAVLPLIVGFGGVNAAGRSSGHQGYLRTVEDALGSQHRRAMWQGLAAVMGCDANDESYMRNHTLVRKIEPQYFDPQRVPWNRSIQAKSTEALQFTLAKKHIPTVLPKDWSARENADGSINVTTHTLDALVADYRDLGVSSAGQVPTGFNPANLYASRNHPRGLQLALVGMTDALGQMGLNWDEVSSLVPPDQISLYSSAAIGQMDETGYAGLLSARARGKRVTSKQLALGLPEMTADFVNAYVLGNVGATGGILGACATFHYNLKLAVDDIKSGRAKIAIAGSAESQITPEVMDGFITMGALGTDQNLLELDKAKGLSEPDVRRACRPFGENCGFTLAEGAQFITLMDDELALEMGADAHDIGLSIHPHPTLSETLNFAAEVAEGSCTDIYAPKK